ncbi:MAG: DNA-binding transcriptional MerR regulator [Dokdonia sp.]|jgi:DNA-binding transcriptional MerR regulator
MSNVVKTKFSIKDLEGLSGIKAHTIRIWEKRYAILDPQRTTTNIRFYTLADLQKLLNVVFLIENGSKISKVGKHSTAEIAQMVAEIVSDRSFGHQNHAINSMKIAMMNFDQNLFYKTYNALLEHKSFVEIFYETFIPLLEEIGYLWQSDTINPSHEHFIFNLIKQKILLNIEYIQTKSQHSNNKTFALFLPENEFHELGLLFLNYEIVSNGYKVIYLGQSIQLESLKYLSLNHPDISFVTYTTVEPDVDELHAYLDEFHSLYGKDDFQLYVLGNRVKDIDESIISDSIRPMLSIREFVNVIKAPIANYA